MSRPHIFGCELTLRCQRCHGEIAIPFEWSSVSAGLDPDKLLLDCIRISFTDHLANDMCSRNMHSELSRLAGGTIHIQFGPETGKPKE